MRRRSALARQGQPHLKGLYHVERETSTFSVSRSASDLVCKKRLVLSDPSKGHFLPFPYLFQPVWLTSLEREISGLSW